MGKIACAHPGKMGDALYALPAIRELCRRRGARADFYTSSYCAPLRRLFEAQECIDKFVVSPDYVLVDFGCGARPWDVPVPGGYDAVFQMGFREYPPDSIPDYIARCAGLPPGLPIKYDFDLPAPDIAGPYIVTAPRGHTAYSPVFRAVADYSPIPVVEVGAAGDGTGSPRAVDRTGLDMLEVLPWLAGCRGFFGLHSAMLVLANGFPVVRVAPQGGWDMRHVVRSVYNHYPSEPGADEVLRLLGAKMTYCKTLDPADYALIHETRHADSIKNIVGTFGGREEHPRRAWEYGLVLHALREVGCSNVLDVGGGGSAFAPAAAWIGMQVTEVDPEDYSAWVAEQSRRIGKSIRYEQCDFMAYPDREFDAVTCISVLEHVPDDFAFYKKLARHVRPGGVLALTVDFWPDAKRKSPDHLRTYNEDRLSALAQSVPGFETLGKLDYGHLGQYVRDYTFASLVLRRK
jgi:ubiquinone/menaquinone biosynthesis C-methylase UbiE